MKTPLIRSVRKSDSGFTLIEVMMAMAILGVGLLSIAVAQITAIKVASKSKNLQQAMFLAREQLDDLDALPPGSAVLQAAATIADPANPIQVGNDPQDGTRFNRQMQVTPNTPSTNLAQVTVTVVWANAATTGNNQVSLTGIKRMN
jgi:prepilin-type N-terminal cleavage/methylation domain-containing protein